MHISKDAVCCDPYGVLTARSAVHNLREHARRRGREHDRAGQLQLEARAAHQLEARVLAAADDDRRCRL